MRYHGRRPLPVWVRVVFLVAFAFCFAMDSFAQDIGPVRPDAVLQSAGDIQATTSFVSDGTWENCYILDGDDPTVVANRFECKPIGDPSGITVAHLVIVTPTGGDVVVRGVTVNAAGLVSAPSINKKTVQSIPFGPNLLSDSTEAQGATGMEDVV